jgi:hypothetical protein
MKFDFTYDVTIETTMVGCFEGSATIEADGPDWRVTEIRLDGYGPHRYGPGAALTTILLPEAHVLHEPIRCWLEYERSRDIEHEWRQHRAQEREDAAADIGAALRQQIAIHGRPN